MSRLRRAGGRLIGAWRARLTEDADASRAALALVLALLTFASAGIAGLQIEAGIRSARAAREAETIGAREVGRDVSARLQTSTDFGVYRRYASALFDRAWASREMPEESASSRALRARIADIDRELEPWVRRQSPLLLPPYFDEAANTVDYAALDADRNVGPAVRALEEREARAAEAADWGARASGYVTTLTVMAVALFFLGLATTMSGVARPVLAVAGLAFGLGAAAAAALITAAPHATVPAAAIDAVVESRKNASRADASIADNVLGDAGRELWQAAVAAADQAVAAAPDHASAYLARAEARIGYANDIVFSPGGDPAEAEPLLAAAMDDFRRYVADRPDSYVAWWNYGWAAYLAGEDRLAIEATDRALALSPEQFTLYLNRALARLSAGEREAAMADVRTAFEVAARSALDSNAIYLANVDYNLGRLVVLRPAQADELAAVQRRTREAAVALRLGRAPGEAGAPIELSLLELRPYHITPEGRLQPGDPIAEGTTIKAAEVVGFRLALSAPSAPRSVISVRVWVDGVPEAAYQTDRPWPSAARQTSLELVSPYGRMAQDVETGSYVVEVFLDGVTRGRHTFRVEAAEDAPAAFALDAPTLRLLLSQNRMTCSAPTSDDRGATTADCQTTGVDADRALTARIEGGADGSIRRLLASGPSAGEVGKLTRGFMGIVAQLVTPAAFAEDAARWVETSAPQSRTTIGAISLMLRSTDDRLELELVPAEAP
ncbi:MAG TPA: tetratricopeptide repeat protein [Candidatus Limnocylindrales bacterium]|nr:tetratricopeptide repeat protein [Candidatus Limnocylindrales bacterium]